MLFGQSLFQSVVQRLEAEAAEAPAEPEQAGFRIKSLGAGFIAEPVAAAGPAAASRYHEMMAETLAAPPPAKPEPVVEPAPIAPQPPTPPAYLLRQAPSEIEADLALEPTDTPHLLAEKRRAFARLNHPDAVAPEFGELAHTRMTIANLLIDAAIRRYAKPQTRRR